jgi:hypothetical protein
LPTPSNTAKHMMSTVVLGRCLPSPTSPISPSSHGYVLSAQHIGVLLR